MVLLSESFSHFKILDTYLCIDLKSTDCTLTELS